MKILRLIVPLFLVVLLCQYALGAGGSKNGTVGELSIDELKTAAEKGDPRAQAVLANRYYEGEGVNKNFKEAEKWMIKSAQDNVDAQAMLGIWYADDRGLPADLTKAYAWLYLASSNGSTEAKKLLLLYDKKLPPETINEAKALSAQLIPSENNTTSDVRFNIGCSSIFVFFALLFWWVVCDGYAGKNKYIHIALQSMGVLFCVYLIFSGIFLLTGWSGFFDWSSADTTPPVRGPKGGLLILIVEFWPYIIMVTGGFFLITFYLELKDLLKEEA